MLYNIYVSTAMYLTVKLAKITNLFLLCTMTNHNDTFSLILFISLFATLHQAFRCNAIIIRYSFMSKSTVSYYYFAKYL